MKIFWKQILCGAVIFFFSFAIFCCSICNLAQNSAQANVVVQSDLILASAKSHHSCCPPRNSSSNEKKCQGSNFLLVLQLEKLNDFVKSNISKISKITFHFSATISNSSRLSLSENFFQSPLKLPQKSVPIYLFVRALRL